MAGSTEAMAVEELVAALWYLDGYLTECRVPIKVPGNYSDLDVVGIRQGCVRIAECKVQEGTNVVFGYDGKLDFNDWLESWGDFKETLWKLWEADSQPAWLPGVKSVDSVEVWFCANMWVPNDLRAKAEKDLTGELNNNARWGLYGKASVQVCSTLEVFTDCVRGVRQWHKQYGWGKRFGNPILDVVRELIRFTDPSLRSMGGDKAQKDALIEHVTNCLDGALWQEGRRVTRS